MCERNRSTKESGEVMKPLQSKIKNPWDGRINNKPPVRKPSISEESVAAIDYLVHELGASYPKVGARIGCSKATVMAAVNRKGAYERIPPYVRKETIPDE